MIVSHEIFVLLLYSSTRLKWQNIAWPGTRILQTKNTFVMPQTSRIHSDRPSIIKVNNKTDIFNILKKKMQIYPFYKKFLQMFWHPYWNFVPASNHSVWFQWSNSHCSITSPCLTWSSGRLNQCKRHSLVWSFSLILFSDCTHHKYVTFIIST